MSATPNPPNPPNQPHRAEPLAPPAYRPAQPPPPPPPPAPAVPVAPVGVRDLRAPGWLTVLGLAASLVWATVTTVLEAGAAVVLSGDPPPAEVLALTDRQAFSVLPHLVLLLATGVLFIAWLHTAHRNVAPLGGGHMRHSSGWAIGGWFVPFLHFVRPWQVVTDVDDASDPGLADPSLREVGRTPGYFALWWGSFLGSVVLGNGADALAGPDLTVTAASSAVMAVSDALWAVAAATAIGVVVRITRRQSALAAARGLTTPRAVVLPRPAVAGLGVVVALAGLGAVALDGPTRALLSPERDGVPYVTAPEDEEYSSVGVLRAGDCYVEHGWDFSQVVVVPCDEPHQFEVLEVVPVDRSGFDSLTEDEIWDLTFAACFKAHDGALRDGTAATGDDLFALAPIGELGIALGDTALCMVVADAAFDPVTT